MRRRDYLAACAAVSAALAGCTGSTDDGGATATDGDPRDTSGSDPATPDTPTTAPGESRTTTAGSDPPETDSPTADGPRRVSMGTTVSADGRRVTVGNPRVRKFVVRNGVHRFLQGHDGQYVVVDVTTGGMGGVDPAFGSSVGGEAVADGGPVPLYGSDEATPRAADEWDGDRVAFPFPPGRPGSAGIRWNGPSGAVVWELPGAVRRSLGLEPEFRVEDLRVRRRDGEFVLAMRIRNVGDRDGHFKAGVSMASFSGRRVVRVDVPAGETREYEGHANGMMVLFENSSRRTLTVEVPDGGSLTTRELDAGTTTDGESTPAGYSR